MTFILAGLYAWIGLAADGPIRVLGLVGAACIAAAPLVARRQRLIAVALLVAGTVPLAVAAWWSIAAPPHLPSIKDDTRTNRTPHTACRP